MALLYRYVKLHDRADSHVFTFVVTRSVTRDPERDVTSKELTCGYQRWAITFSRTDKVLGVYLVWKSASQGMRVYVDFTFTLLNREHFSCNEAFAGKQVRRGGGNAQTCVRSLLPRPRRVIQSYPPRFIPFGKQQIFWRFSTLYWFEGARCAVPSPHPHFNWNVFLPAFTFSALVPRKDFHLRKTAYTPSLLPPFSPSPPSLQVPSTRPTSLALPWPRTLPPSFAPQHLSLSLPLFGSLSSVSFRYVSLPSPPPPLSLSLSLSLSFGLLRLHQY
ncbi:hypothetical protein ONE63_005248 [Megalurothrips usitatus]|uniref:Uncharacterized protein n=1 Tax=Megalurothrips usitatus TaxID=439358 RepID=A0AAV7XYQ9_9NEOP|nr:hypothetical protein ONE63_005248 [Megalurothrips usitatus]